MLNGIVNQVAEATFIEKLSLISALIVICPVVAVGFARTCKWFAKAFRWANGMRKEFAPWEPVRKSERAHVFSCVMGTVCALLFVLSLGGGCIALKVSGINPGSVPFYVVMSPFGFGFLAVFWYHLMAKYNPAPEAKREWRSNCDCVNEQNMRGAAGHDWYMAFSDDGHCHVHRRNAAGTHGLPVCASAAKPQ